MEAMNVVCPVCGDEWSEDMAVGMLAFMDEHEREHGADIPADYFFEVENDTMVRNP